MSNIKNLRNKYPEYTYKEATLNPTNPASRATDWESGVIEHFRNNTEQSEMIGERDTASGRMLYVARPIQIKKESCLQCHGQVADAPKTMLLKYGQANGFGWKLNEVVGSQIVSVPMTLPLARADSTLHTFMILLFLVFLSVFVILNLFLHFIVINPIKDISSLAHDTSMGKMDVTDCDASGKDEIASLAGSFNRMKRSLVNAIEMLGD